MRTLPIADNSRTQKGRHSIILVFHRCPYIDYLIRCRCWNNTWVSTLVRTWNETLIESWIKLIMVLESRNSSSLMPFPSHAQPRHAFYIFVPLIYWLAELSSASQTDTLEAGASEMEWRNVKALTDNRIRWRIFVDAICSQMEKSMMIGNAPISLGFCRTLPAFILISNSILSRNRLCWSQY